MHTRHPIVAAVLLAGSTAADPSADSSVSGKASTNEPAEAARAGALKSR